MCLYSEFFVEWEKNNLAPYAVHSDDAWYVKRQYTGRQGLALDPPGDRSRYRTAFEIDKDRITNSQAFRRMEYKTQVFVTHEGDNYRTRLTHSLEVAETARHIARALRLNEHLVEAIALGHDLGHAPYGHSGEDAINSWLLSDHPDVADTYYFCHNRNSVEVVEHLEPGYDWDRREPAKGLRSGLNLTRAVREGMLVHTNRGYRGPCHRKVNLDPKHESAIRCLSRSNREKGLLHPGSLEAQVVRIADDIAQRIHDLEDGFRFRMLDKDTLRDALEKYFLDLDEKMFGPGWADLDDRDLVHENTKKTIPKLFIADILDMLEEGPRAVDKKGERRYSGPDPGELGQLNELLGSDSEENRPYQETFRRAAAVAFLLHMWRDGEYLARESKADQQKSRSRILKYLTLLEEILGHREADPAAPLSGNHYIAFLRGLMIANVIEHSYVELHRLLNPDFRAVSGENTNKGPDGKSDVPVSKRHCMVLVTVDGTYQENKVYLPVDEKKRLVAVWFANEKKMARFLRKKILGRIRKSNGATLTRLAGDVGDLGTVERIEKVTWINKSTKPAETAVVRIDKGDGAGEWLPLGHVRVVYTGYLDLCPCANRNEVQCDYLGTVKQGAACPHYTKGLPRPDVNRVIKPTEYMAELDQRLEEVVSDRIHKASRVARMNFMGKKIVDTLLSTYAEFPRAMHDRVWNRLRKYPKRKRIHRKVKKFIKQIDRSGVRNIVPEKALAPMLNEGTHHADSKYSLIRRIVEHVSGMTDRYISVEYNRLTQSGREAELQDESYE